MDLTGTCTQREAHARQTLRKKLRTSLKFGVHDMSGRFVPCRARWLMIRWT